MKKAFRGSLCREGVLGGGIYVDDKCVMYRTQKITVSEKYKKLILEYKDMESISAKRVFIFPVVTIRMKDKEVYKFVIFSCKKFVSLAEGYLKKVKEAEKG